MSHRAILSLAVGCLLVFQAGFSHASIIELETGITFQDDDVGPWPTQVDDTSRLTNVDDDWAPSVPIATTTGAAGANYYATGTAGFYYDAVSLSFDLSSVGFENITGTTLRFYTQKGGYATVDGTQAFNADRNAWEHYQILQGAFNSTNEDRGPFDSNIVGTLVDFGGVGALAPDSIVGWLEESIDASWITSNDFDVTLRLWNARIDAVELRVETEQVPVPATLALLGLGLAGLGFKRCKRLA